MAGLQDSGSDYLGSGTCSEVGWSKKRWEPTLG